MGFPIASVVARTVKSLKFSLMRVRWPDTFGHIQYVVPCIFQVYNISFTNVPRLLIFLISE